MKGSHDRFADKTAILGYGWAAAAGRKAAEAVQRGDEADVDRFSMRALREALRSR